MLLKTCDLKKTGFNIHGDNDTFLHMYNGTFLHFIMHMGPLA